MIAGDYLASASELPHASKESADARIRSLGRFAALTGILIVLHAALLKLPYLWDEAGYYIPAARDLLLDGTFIPHSTISNAHPPLVMAWLALWWKIFGCYPVTTRIAMLMVASFTLLGVFGLARLVANTGVAIASTSLTALYSIFFMQSSLAHLDLAAAGFTIWGLHSYLEDRPLPTAIWFSLAALTKETAILAPFSILAWELIKRWAPAGSVQTASSRPEPQGFMLLIPFAPLALWFAYHYARTGYVFGNPEFFRYNVKATLHPLRIILALAMRVWQLTGYMHLWLLTIAGLMAMFLPPLRDSGRERPRIAISIQAVFLTVVLAYVLAMALVGGAVLARYMLPVLPLVIILWTSTLWRRVIYWKAVIGIVALAFVAAWLINPPYGFSFEDNLAYRDYILLHEHAEDFLQSHFPSAHVLTAWPASDEISRPYLGYVSRPLRVVRIEDFSFQQTASAAASRSQYDVALVFSTKYLPPNPLLGRWPPWERLKEQYFGFHRDLPLDIVAQMLDGKIIYRDARHGQWIGIVEVQPIVEAKECQQFP